MARLVLISLPGPPAGGSDAPAPFPAHLQLTMSGRGKGRKEVEKGDGGSVGTGQRKSEAKEVYEAKKIIKIAVLILERVEVDGANKQGKERRGEEATPGHRWKYNRN